MAVYTVTSIADSGAGSMREAIGLANANPGADTIEIGALVSGGGVTLTTGQLSVTDALTIDGDYGNLGRPDWTINANGASRVITTSADLTLIGLTITGGAVAGEGGGVLSTGIAKLNIQNSAITGNSTTGNDANGGGIATGSGSITLTNSTVTGNSTAGVGSVGGGFFSNSNVILNDSLVVGNVTKGAGTDGDETQGIVTNNRSIVGGNAAALFASTYEVAPGVLAGVLAGNGGSVPTVALLSVGSNPALDKSGAGAPANDARGSATQDFAAIPNINGSARDLGAFELQNNPGADTPTVTTAVTNEDTKTTSGLVIARSLLDGAEVTHFKITGITGGTLYQNNGTTPIANGEFITFAQGNAGLKFLPSPNSTADGSFNVQASLSASNAGLGGGLAPALINVISVDDAPVAPATNSVSTQEDVTAAPVVIGATDADGDIVSYGIKPGAAPLKGSVTFVGDTFIYEPGGAANGADSFTIVITDAEGHTAEQVVSVSIAPVPDAPTAIDDAATATAGQTKQIPASDLLANDFDLDGDPVSLVSVGNPVGGTVSVSNGTVSFTPAAGFAGAGGFDYTIGDGQGGSDTAHVTVTVAAGSGGGGGGGGSGSGQNRAPVIAPVDPVKLAGDEVIVHVSASDADGDALSYSAAGAAHGSVTGGSGGAFVYRPTAGYAGADSFTVTVSDGKGGTANANVSVSVINLPGDTDWTVTAPTGHIGEIGGSGDYIGTSGFQKVTVLDLPGLISFDASIASVNLANLFIPAGTQGYGPVPGGAGSLVTGSNAAERIVLAADAQVVLEASFVRGNDTVAVLGNSASYAIAGSVAGILITSAAGAYIRVPSFAPGGGIALEFSDRTLQLTTSDGVNFRLGSQAIGAAPGMIGTGLPAAEPSAGTLVYRGGDLLDLPGDADQWCIAELDSKVLLTDGDTHVLLPVGAPGVLLAFGDGLRTLAFDPHTQTYHIGVQTFGEDLAGITAPAQALALPAGGNPAVQASLELEAGGVVSVGGKFLVEGTPGAEFVTILQGDFVFGSSFAAGGDAIGFNFAAPAYTAVRQGDAVLLDGSDMSALLPAGSAGTSLDFDGQVRELSLDA